MSDRDLDEFLARTAATPRLTNPDRFVDQVMRRVALEPRRAWQPAAALPWWVEAAADPAAALACVLMALVLWKPTALVTLVQAAAGWRIPSWLPTAWARSILDPDRPTVTLGLQILGSILLAWASLYLYRWTERLVRRAGRV
jgi:hypothetical protein